MQSERVSLPSLASLDEEFGGPNKPVVPEQDYQRSRRRRRYVCFLVAGAALAMTSIVLWSNNALRVWALAQSLPSFSAQQTASQSSAGSEQREELDAVKKQLSELRGRWGCWATPMGLPGQNGWIVQLELGPVNRKGDITSK